MERANQEIKKYLRKFINHNQDDWSEHLLMLEFSYNIKKADQHTFTSYQIVYGEISAITAKERMIDIQKQERLQEEAKKIISTFPVPEYKEND